MTTFLSRQLSLLIFCQKDNKFLVYCHISSVFMKFKCVKFALPFYCRNVYLNVNILMGLVLFRKELGQSCSDSIYIEATVGCFPYNRIAFAGRFNWHSGAFVDTAFDRVTSLRAQRWNVNSPTPLDRHAKVNAGFLPLWFLPTPTTSRLFRGNTEIEHWYMKSTLGAVWDVGLFLGLIWIFKFSLFRELVPLAESFTDVCLTLLYANPNMWVIVSIRNEKPGKDILKCSFFEAS